jgi:hypothetical protein
MDGFRSRGRFRCLAFVFRRTHPRVAGANVSVHPRSSKAVRESQNRGECRCGCKAAWYRQLHVTSADFSYETVWLVCFFSSASWHLFLGHRGRVAPESRIALPSRRIWRARE